MKKRADDVRRTRERITEATVRLHTTVGPAHTTISAIAAEAGVTRLTVYNHFPDEEQLFLACSAHWAANHPAPDPEPWAAIADPAERARTAFTQVYGWYDANSDDLYPLQRDVDAMPPALRRGWAESDAIYAEALLHGAALRGAHGRRARAISGHLVSYWTWRSLAVDNDLGTPQAVAIATDWLVAVIARPSDGNRRTG